jgi:hypothetical protein
LRSTRKPSKQQAPTWLNDAVYEPKRRRTVELVKQAIDRLVEQRKQDGVTRISLTTITAMAKQLDPASQGIAHTSILENAEAYAYYKKFRTASKLKKQRAAPKSDDARLVIKGDRDQARVRQHYMKWNRAELVDRLLSVEQQYAALDARYLAMSDTALEWQLRAEAAETALSARQERSQGADGQERSRSSSSKQRHRKPVERNTGPLPKHLVSLLSFANCHNVSEQKVLAHVTMDLPLLKAVRGEWTDTDGSVITLALDQAGRATFYQLYHGVPPFFECDQCPHQEMIPSGGKEKP